MTPIEIINAEMQKHPGDQNIEKIGHYLIDKNLESIPEGKTLMGCMEFMGGKVVSMAKSYGKFKMAALSDEEGHAWIDEYYGLQHVEKAVSKAPVETDTIDLADFF